MGEAPLRRALAPDDDPELAVLKDQRRGAVKAALEQSIARLTPKERNLLRMNFVHGLSIDEIGGNVPRVPRSTVARWLVAIRGRLNQESRRVLREQRNFSEAEVDSLLKLVESNIHVSFVRLLDSGDR